MRNELPNKQVKRLHEILNDHEQGNLTKNEATDLGFMYLLETGFTPQENLSLPQFYIRMVTENMDNLQWATGTKKDLALRVAEAIGSNSVELQKIDKEGICEDGDYGWLVGIFENWGYIDSSYSKMAFGSKYRRIVEIRISDE